MDGDGDDAVGVHCADLGCEAYQDGLAVEVQVFAFVLVFDLDHGGGADFVVVEECHAVLEGAVVFGAVVTVLHGIAAQFCTAAAAGWLSDEG